MADATRKRTRPPPATRKRRRTSESDDDDDSSWSKPDSDTSDDDWASDVVAESDWDTSDSVSDASAKLSRSLAADVPHPEPISRSADADSDTDSSSSSSSQALLPLELVGYRPARDDDDKPVAAVAVSSSSSDKPAAISSSSSDRPVAAVSSSSSDVPAPAAAAPRETYYYWIDDGCSYTMKQLTAHFEHHRGGKLAECKQTYKTMPSISGLGDYYDYGVTPEEVIEHRSSQFIRDVSRTAGDTVCCITTERYERPHLLSLNGRSYSEAAITKAIDKTLKVGEPLRLEDITIDPDQLLSIRLYPNHGLDGWPVIHYTEGDMARAAPFDGALATRRNIPIMSAAFNAIKPGRNPVWDDDICEVFRKSYLPNGRSDQSAAPVDYSNPPLFRDLVLSQVVFPRVHPKHPARFVNVKFDQCLVYYACFCGLKLTSCLFHKCTIFVDYQYHRPGVWRRCDFDSCEFVFGTCPGRDDAPPAACQHATAQMSNGGIVRGCTYSYAPSDTITEALANRASIDTLRRRIGIALGRVAPRPDDGMTFKARVDGKWVPAASPAATLE